MALLWLATPLLLLPWLMPPRKMAHAAGQLVLAGLGLAALQQGEQTLSPAALGALAASAAGDAQFIGITVGALASGLLIPAARSLRSVAATLPLVVGLATLVPHLAVGALMAGLLIGAVPWVLAAATGVVTDRVAPRADRVEPPGVLDWRSGTLAAAAALAGWFAPLVAAAALLVVLVWNEWRSRQPGGLVAIGWAGATTMLVAAWGWLAVTIAGSIVVPARGFERVAPVSPAAETLLALLVIGWLLALLPPWPLDRLPSRPESWPALVLLSEAVAVHGVGVGVAHWQPLLSALLVVSALVALLLLRWNGATAGFVLLGATRAGWLGCAGAIAIATLRLVTHGTGPRRPAWRPAAALVAGLGGAAIVAALLQDEVVLGVTLGLGAPAAAALAARRVARSADPAHL